MKDKFCDIIVANDVSKKGTGFNVDFNEVTIIDRKGSDTIWFLLLAIKKFVSRRQMLNALL